MRRTRHVVLPVKSWQYMGLMLVSLACLTLGLVSRDRGGRSESLAGPELQHSAPHEVDACPNSHPFLSRKSFYDDSEQHEGKLEADTTRALISVRTLENRSARERRSIVRDRENAKLERREEIQSRIRDARTERSERSDRNSARREIRSRRLSLPDRRSSENRREDRVARSRSEERRSSLGDDRRRERDARRIVRSANVRENRENRSNRLSESRDERIISRRTMNERKRRMDSSTRRSMERRESSASLQRTRSEDPQRARSLERGSTERRNKRDSTERRSGFSTILRSKERQITPERHERRFAILSRTSSHRSLQDGRTESRSSERRSTERRNKGDSAERRSGFSTVLRSKERQITPERHERRFAILSRTSSHRSLQDDRTESRSSERGSTERRNKGDSAERRSGFSTVLRSKERQITPERHERRFAILSRTSSHRFLQDGRTESRSSERGSAERRIFTERRIDVTSNLRSRERDATSERLNRRAAILSRAARVESSRNGRREVRRVEERTQHRRAVDQVERLVSAERRNDARAEQRNDISSRSRLETERSRRSLERTDINRRERRLNSLQSRLGERRAARLDAQRTWVDSLRRNTRDALGNREERRSVSAEPRRIREAENRESRASRISRANERRVSVERRITLERQASLERRERVGRELRATREQNGRVAAISRALVQQNGRVREETRNERRHETIVNDPYYFVKNNEVSESNEYLRQATILLLCAVYGVSLLRGKGGFYSFRDIVNPIKRSIVG